MTTLWNNARKTVPISEYDKFKHKFDNFRQIDLEQFTNVDGMTNFYDIKDIVVDKVDDVMKFINQQETTCADINNTNNTSTGNSTNSNVTPPSIGTMTWLTDSIGISNINIPSNPNKNQGFTPVGDSYKPKNRGYLTGFLNDGFSDRDMFSGMKDRYRNIVRKNLGLNKLNDYINSLNSIVNEWVNKIHSNTNKSHCVNKKNVLKDSTIIINEISKILVIPGVFWMTNNIFYISIYENVNCYRPELPDIWDYFLSFDKIMGGNSLLSSIPKYIFEFSVYAPHYINQAIRKIICNLPFRDSFVVFYYILILFTIIIFKGVVNTHLFVADSIQMNDTQLSGIAFFITLIAGLQYWYVNWYNNIVFKFVGGVLIWFLVIIVMFVINLIFVSNMYNLGLFVLSNLFYIYANWAIVFFDHSGDNMFQSIWKLFSKLAHSSNAIININNYIYKIIYDDLKKGNTIMHNIKKYLFYFIYEISIIGILAVSISNFNNIKDERIQKAFQYSYVFFIILILISSSIRYSWDPPISSNDMNIFEKFINDYIFATLFNGSMEYLNEFYSHTELTNCQIERLKNPDEYKECDVKILDDKMNKTLFSKGTDFFTNISKSLFGLKNKNPKISTDNNNDNTLKNGMDNFKGNVMNNFNDTVNNIKNEFPKNLEKTIETNVTTATNAINPNSMFSMISDKLKQNPMNPTNLIPNNINQNILNNIGK